MTTEPHTDLWQRTYYGSVQGVGFRWRARHAADLYGCTGWVHNKWDGTVEMEIQGEEEQIDRVIQSVSSGHFVSIERMDVKTIPVDEERSFRTRQRNYAVYYHSS